MFTGHATRTEKKCFELEKIKKQSQVVFIGTDKQIYQPDQERKPTTLKTVRISLGVSILIHFGMLSRFLT